MIHTDRKPARYLVGILASPFSESLIRLTRAEALAAGARWLGVFVDTGVAYRADEKALLDYNTELVRSLGGEVLSVQNVDLVDGILRTAQQNEVTRIIVGKSQRGRLRNWWSGGSVVARLLRESGAIDVHVVASEFLPRARPLPPGPAVRRRNPSLRQWTAAAAVMASFFAVASLLDPWIGYQAVGLVFLIAVFACALFFSRPVVFAIAVVASLIHNYCFIPPRHTFAIHAPQDVLVHFLFFVTAFAIGHLTTRLRRQNRIIQSREDRALELFHLARAIADAPNRAEVMAAGIRVLEKRFGGRAWVASSPDQSVTPKSLRFALRDKGDSLGEMILELPRGLELDYLEREFAEAVISQVAAGLEREALRESQARLAVLEGTERLYRNLFDSVSHELKSPLTTLQGAASLLGAHPSPDVADLGQQLGGETSRLLGIVDNMLDMTRLESGTLRPRLQDYDLADLVGPALRSLAEPASGREVRISIAQAIPPVLCDGPLVVQALANIIGNALKYSPSNRPIHIEARHRDGWVEIEIRDEGPGLPNNSEIVFQKFYREHPRQSGGVGLGLSIAKGFLEAQGGSLRAASHPQGGAVFTLSLRVAS